MSSNQTRAHASVARTVVVAAATGIAALTLAGPAPAGTEQILVDQDISACTDCAPVVVPLTATAALQHVALTSPGNSDCARAVAEVSLDGQSVATRYVGPGWGQGPFDINVAQGNHNLSVLVRNQSDCKTGGGMYGAHIKVWEDIKPIGKVHQKATVLQDVDVYDQPDGVGTKTGIFLKAPREVELTATGCRKDWCNVFVPELPNGSGWVYQPDFLEVHW